MNSSLINLSPPDRPLDRALLEARGGFLWWYVDLVDQNGDGLVLIWSFGLPFLPGYASAARRGRARPAGQRPSLNISVYRGGELDFYLLQEYAPEAARWAGDGEVWQFGDSRIEASIEDGRMLLRAQLDCPVRGSAQRLQGHVEVDGVCRRPHITESALTNPHHDWTPRLGPARGRAHLAHGDDTFVLSGRAYHDRNGGARPLHELGIDYWLWGRVPIDERELIYYLLWPTDAAEPVVMGLEIDADGHTEVLDDLDVELGAQRRNLGGLDWWEQITLSRAGSTWLQVSHAHVVDSGPFYMRYLTAARGRRGVGELVKPDRVDLDHHRPLVRMRVHHVDGRNSMWLPLFCGPRQGRVRRLLRSWLGGGGS